MKTTVLFGVLALIVSLAFAAPAVVAQDKSSDAISLRLATIEDQLDKILVLLQRMDEKSKREEYFAGCVPEATQCSEGASVVLTNGIDG